MKKYKERNKQHIFQRIFALILILSVCILLVPIQTQAATKATSVTASQTAYVLKVGKSVSLKATLKPSNVSNRKVRWKSSKPSVASVSSNGKVKAIKPGKATITVMARDGSKKKDTVKITVVKNVKKIKSIKIRNTTKTVEVGKKLTLKTSITPSKASLKTLNYSSSNPAIATVSEKGVVKGVRAGTVTIKVEAQDGSRKKASVKIKVTAKKTTSTNANTSTSTETSSENTVVESIPVTGVLFDSDYIEQTGTNTYKLTTYENRTKKLNVTIAPSNATNKILHWESSNRTAATVTQQGVITGVTAGQTTTITATSISGAKASCVVEVEEAIKSASVNESLFKLDYYLNLRDTTAYRMVRENTPRTISASRFNIAQLAMGTTIADANDGADAFYQILRNAQSGNDILNFLGDFNVSNVSRTLKEDQSGYETISFAMGSSTGTSRQATCTDIVVSTGTRSVKDAAVSSGVRTYTTKVVRFKLNVAGSDQNAYLKVEMVDSNGSMYIYASDLESVVSAANGDPYLSVVLENNRMSNGECAQQYHIQVDNAINSEICAKFSSFPDFREISFFNIYSDFSGE